MKTDVKPVPGDEINGDLVIASWRVRKKQNLLLLTPAGKVLIYWSYNGTYWATLDEKMTLSTH